MIKHCRTPARGGLSDTWKCKRIILHIHISRDWLESRERLREKKRQLNNYRKGETERKRRRDIALYDII